MRGEIREGEQGKPEVWVSLDDVLEWLAELPQHAHSPTAAGAALEIRQYLIDFVGNAKFEKVSE